MSEQRYTIGHPLNYDLPGWSEPARPGVFWYSGFGLGHYFGADGFKHWMTTTEASDRARAEGVPFLWLDPMRLQPTPFTTKRGK